MRIAFVVLLSGLGLHACSTAGARTEVGPVTVASATAPLPDTATPAPPRPVASSSPWPLSEVPASPSATPQTFGVGEGVLFVKALEDLLVVGNDQGVLSFLDISDPSLPRPLAHIPLGREEYRTFVIEELPVAIRDAEVRDDLVFLISVTTLFVFDLADPANPIELTRLELPERLNDLQIRGLDLWIAVADTIRGINRLLIVDASDPSHPVLAGDSYFPNSVPSRIRLAGDLAYVTAREEETAPDLRLFAIGDPLYPTEVRPVAGLPAFRAWIRDSVAYVATGRYVRRQPVGIYTEASSVAVVSVADPQKPEPLGYIWTPQLAVDLVAVGNDVFIVGDKFPGSGDMVLTMWLIVADLRDPGHPLLAHYVKLEGFAETLAYSRGYAYIAAGPAGIHVVSATAAVLIDTLTLQDLYAP